MERGIFYGLFWSMIVGAFGMLQFTVALCVVPRWALTSGQSSLKSIWPTVLQIPPPLKHSGEFREVRLEPILLTIALGRLGRNMSNNC